MQVRPVRFFTENSCGRAGKGRMFFWHSPLDFYKSQPIVLPSFGVFVLLLILQVKVQGADAQSSNKIV
jgi:hypothetical protein